MIGLVAANHRTGELLLMCLGLEGLGGMDLVQFDGKDRHGTAVTIAGRKTIIRHRLAAPSRPRSL